MEVYIVDLFVMIQLLKELMCHNDVFIDHEPFFLFLLSPLLFYLLTIFPPILEPSLLDKFAQGILYQLKLKPVASLLIPIEMAPCLAPTSVDSMPSLRRSSRVSSPPESNGFSLERHVSHHSSLQSISIPPFL